LQDLLEKKELREEGIKAWLTAHPETTKFAILDDDLVVFPKLIKTTYNDGLLDAHVESTVVLLTT
jgi:hypothetical protein